MASITHSNTSALDFHALTHSDVLIIGAGASGLAAAKTLSQRGLRVRILEARHRIGGRIFTVRDPLLNSPVELGAEFIHGSAPETNELVRQFGMMTFQTSDSHYHTSTDGPQIREGEWDDLTRTLGRLKKMDTDLSFNDFIKSQTDLSNAAREAALGFIEGFQAADSRQISTNSLAEDDGSGINDATETMRLMDGYDQIPQVLLRACDPSRTTLHLNTVVSEIHWRKGRVDVVAKLREGSAPKQFSASRAIITLPWGVLHASPGASAHVSEVRFEPEPTSLTAARGALAMGHAARITLHFRKAFWEEFTDKTIGYLHGDAQSAFPVWWTLQPCHAPLWVGWMGGPKAQALAALGESKILDKAIEALGKNLGCGAREVTKNLQTWHYHDWSHDPYSQGAYSFVKTGGLAAAQALAVPIESTLYFAGEATQRGGSRGTVDGALRSGYDAAAHILADSPLVESQIRSGEVVS